MAFLILAGISDYVMRQIFAVGTVKPEDTVSDP
jgi:hypothetical protein